jgi:protein-S-isoprenylcysteine O-methyltransferase Ste14
MNTALQKIRGAEGGLFELVLIWGAVWFYRTNSYYTSFLQERTQTALFYLAITYTLAGLVTHVMRPYELAPTTKGKILVEAIKRLSKETYTIIRQRGKELQKPLLQIDKSEKTALLFIVVKLFFLPLMINFLLGNYTWTILNLHKVGSLDTLFSIRSFNEGWFPLLLSLLFFIDTLWFSAGYAFESKKLKNTVRSVEPTILGWIVALACYPPFNSIITQYTNWYANDHTLFFTEGLTFTLRIIMLILIGIYVWATLALGAKSSNLTNRGIVSRGPYAFIRHPAYISKNLMWWITLIPIASWTALGSMAVWSCIYHLRAITEERHLMQDPDYQEYRKIVRYRYIPYIY